MKPEHKELLAEWEEASYKLGFFSCPEYNEQELKELYGKVIEALSQPDFEIECVFFSLRRINSQDLLYMEKTGEDIFKEKREEIARKIPKGKLAPFLDKLVLDFWQN